MQHIIPIHAQRLTQDLLDALWLEDLYGFRAQCSLRAEHGEMVLDITLDHARSLCWHGRRAQGLRPFRVSQRPPVLRAGIHMHELTVIAAVEMLETAEWWRERSGRCARLFRLAERQAAFTAAHEPDILARLGTPQFLLAWEGVSCLRDRPFHPLARAKEWNGEPSADFSPETATPITLHWVALPRERVLGGVNVGQPVAESMLDERQLKTLASVAYAHRASGEAYLWLPVHPWQWRRLKEAATPDLADCMDLGAGPGTALPTVSLRSLAISGRPDTHIKLALSVQALGALRTLPPRYLHNGALAFACLDDLRRRDTWLAAHLLLCDERQWWALRQRDFLQAEPGELACLIRRYPALPAGTTLMPMAALPATTAAGALPAFDYLLGSLVSENAAWTLFADIARALLELGLRCYAHGVLPELHGQNVLLACRGAHVVALVLRDHDSLRICPPLMQAAGTAVPDYVLDCNTPNTLVLDSPRDLLAYLQTLAIEVNLYAVLAALAEHYGRGEAYGWDIVRMTLVTCLATIPLPEHLAAQSRSLLLGEPSWPFKQVLTPLLDRAQIGTGMPSAMGRLANPLLHQKTEVHLDIARP